MAFSQILKTHLQPSIKLIELGDFDNSAEGESPQFSTRSKNLPDFSQTAGKTAPFVKIEGRPIHNIDRLTIDESGFIPVLELMFTDGNGEFAGNYFPKRNLMVSLFINSASDKLKPIRSDYLITSIKSISPQNRGSRLTINTGVTYIIKADLFVPRLYNSVSKSYSNMTSVDALKSVCGELGLGYAQNEFTPSDTMTWVNINTSPSNFIKEILNYAYQDDNSFFSGFISKEMILTMVNVNEQLKVIESDLTFSNAPDTLSVSLTQDQKDNPAKSAFDDLEVINVLTNRRTSSGKANYIYEANLISEHGSILKYEGYKKKIYYYDHLESSNSKFKSFFIAPTNTDGASDTSMLIPSDEGLDEIGNKKWMNINYGNTHEHWNAARVFNSHNLKELDKIKLKVLLKGVNFQVIRGMTIPIVLTQSTAEKIARETDANNQTDANPTGENIDEETIDTQLSGWYYVKEAKYIFDPTDPHQFLTELVLARREWATNKIKFTANA
jgi:hypothetical protein